MTTNAALTENIAETPEEVLREVIETLAPLERLAGSDGEREAAEWIADRLGKAGARAHVEEAKFRGDFAGVIAGLAALGAAGGVLAASRSKLARKAGVAAGVAAAGLIADDISNGFRPFRKAVRQEKTTWNVVGEIGDPNAERTLVVLAHHDAAQTGFIFDPTFQEKLIEKFPGVVERIDTSLPLWWLVLAGPLLTAAGGASGKRGLARAGAAISAGSAATMADIQRNDVVPGANDNLTAVAVLVATAEALAAEPIEGLRVQLVSAGAEEVLQGGIYGYCERHLANMNRERTWVLNVETVGGPSLALLEGEGPVVMEDYFDRPWRDLIAQVAHRKSIPLRRGMRSRNSTDSVIPSRMGVPTATIVALDRYKALSNYHSHKDTPENIQWPTVACAADLSIAVARELAARP